MKTKQSITPGPWRMDGTNGRDIYTKKHGLIAATRYLGNSPQAEAEHAANARAIAAVPDLIAALESAYDRLATLDDADEATDNDIEVMGDIRNALAKAGIRG